MKHRRIVIRPVAQEPPDLDRFVAALLALAIARLEEQAEDAPDEEGHG